MSAETVSMNAGTVHASVRRRAIVLRMFERGCDCTSPDATGAAGRAAAGAGLSTSCATIRPSGPLPRRLARSMPRSRASRRASGDALMRPFVVGSDTRFGSGTVSDTVLVSDTFGWGAGASTATVSPSLPMKAIVRPTSTSPSATAIFKRTPLASASTSWVTLSVSSSYSGSPFATGSPSDLSQRTIVPDSMP